MRKLESPRAELLGTPESAWHRGGSFVRARRAARAVALSWLTLAAGCGSDSTPAGDGVAGAAPSGAGASATDTGGLGAGGLGAGGAAPTNVAGTGNGDTSAAGALNQGGTGQGGGAVTIAGASSGGASSAGQGGGFSHAGSAGSAGGAGAAGGAAPSQVGIPKNPVLKGLYADPQVAAFNDKFYIYPTSDGFADWMSTSFKAFSSSDLVTWKDEGVILDLGPGVTWADSQAWAPSIAFANGTYYFYFAAAMQIGVATAKSPTGPFKDALGKPLVTKGQYGGQSIDPYVFTDDDGKSYLYFGSGSTAHVAELNTDMVSFKSSPKTISIAGYREGSVAFKRKGTYYFMYSVGDTRDADYDVAYGMGTSATGPFTKPATNPILQKNTAQGILGTGHNSVLQLANGDFYIVYHRFAIPNGDGTHREVCIDRMNFNADGTIAPVKPTL